MYGTVSAVVEVEANSYDEAVSEALNNAPNTSFADSDFDGVSDWEVESEHYIDGEYIESTEATK
jgi:hypothetical protein